MKPKILIIENSVAVTGAFNSILRSCDHFRDRYDFTIFLPKGNSVKEIVEEHGFAAKEIPMKEIHRNFYSLLIYLPFLFANSIRLIRYVRKHRTALIVNNDFYNLLPAAYKIFGGSTPYICFVRFLPDRFPRPLVWFWSTLHYKLANTTIAVSETVRRQLKDSTAIVIGNELPSYAPNVSIASEKIILFPSNYIRGKGQEHALRSFARISNKYPEWKLRFTGGDMGLKKNNDFKRELIELAKDLGINRQVQWLDFSKDIVLQYYQSAFVLLFSESESFSLVCQEAMYCRRAVIATRCGGPEEIIEHNNTGLLVKCGNTEEMSEAIERLIKDVDFRQRIAERGRESIMKKYSFENTVDKLLKVYQQNISKDSQK